jgi:chromate transporter
MMQDEVVKKRGWITDEHFLDLISATNLLPGPNSTEMTMHIGHERAGWRGLIVAGICFIFPAVVLTSVFAWAYQLYGSLPDVPAYIYGIKPAIVGIILSAMLALGRKAFKTVWLAVLGALTFIACIAGVGEITALFGAGMIGAVLHILTQPKKDTQNILPAITGSAKVLSTTKIFLTFLKVGAVLYGSGYVLFAFLNDELVKTGLLNHTQLADAIAVGQFTPGPLFSAATFIGWQMAGWKGAAAATAGIFLPSFLFVLFLNPLIPRLRRSVFLSAFLDAINAASVAIILFVCIDIFKSAVSDWRAIVILIISLSVSIYFKKVNAAIVVLGGALLGYLLLAIR